MRTYANVGNIELIQRNQISLIYKVFCAFLLPHTSDSYDPVIKYGLTRYY